MHRAETPAGFDPFAGPLILDTAPSTAPQREVWTGASLGDDASLAFNESVTLWMDGALDVEALRQALSDLVARHEALRSTFSADGLTLLVGTAGPLDVPLHDWSGQERVAQARAWEALLAEEVERPFDLTRGPLFRARLVRCAPEAHRLVLTAHHLVCDGWSTGVLMRELAQLYSAHARRAAPALEAAESFAAYARAEAEPSPTRAADEAYWTKQLGGELPVLELPCDRTRPPAKTYAARRLDAVLDAELVAGLKRTGARHRASLFATLLAGFHALLHRLTGQEDVVVGIPSAGQGAGGHDGLVGHCVNTLPIRARPAGARPFTELLGQVRGALLDAQEHQALTFGSLLQLLPLPRDPSRLPLVSVVFNLDKGLGPDALAFDGLAVRLSTNPRHFETFDLFVNAVELDGRVTLEVQYNTDLLERETVARWLAAYELLLRAVAGDTETPVGRLPVLTQTDRVRLAAVNDAARAPGLGGTCVHALIAAQCAATPERIAAEFEGRTLTYGVLQRRARQLARRLRALGVGRGDLVGLCAERSVEMLVGLLGILEAGAAYVPLDPGYPAERLAFMVQDARLEVLVAHAHLGAELGARQVVALDREETYAGVDDGPLAPDARDATPEDPAYVIYTSGSTGRPKGVLVPHRALSNLVQSVQRTPGLGADDVVLAVTTLSFDIAVSELVAPLTVGARIVVASRELASDGARLLEALHAHRVTFLDATPATYRLLLGAGWQRTPGLRVVCTGEAMPRDLAQELVPRCDAVWNGYGPTETTVWSTFWQVTAPVGRVLIGRPVANTQVYVLDALGEPVPAGVQGELYLGGAGVTLGYLGRPELTRERFVPDRFGGTPGALLYRTGDVVRLLPDGTLECLGRNDHQVKLRGFRIELGEIEDALTQHPRVRQAAVVVREDRPGDKRLVGYVTCDGEVDDAALRAHLQRTLPDYMLPGAWVRLPVMPLTPSGKIDRRALPAPQAGEGGTGAQFVAPRTPTEQRLAELWCEVLSLGRVSVLDDFFALGGHSLLASQVLARLKRDLGVALSFRTMFEAPTIARLAERVDAQRAGPERVPAAVPAGIPPLPADAAAPLSLLQERLWLLEEMDPSQRLIHNLPAAWRIEGPLDAALLERCLNELVRRHDMLRTHLAVEDGRRVQRVVPAWTQELTHVDLTGVPAAEREAELERRMDAATRELFDLTRLPLLRTTLYRLGEQDHVLYTLRHNAIWDGWSFDIFLQELSALYGALHAGQGSPLAPLPVRYAEYAAWHRGWLEGEELARQRAYWQRQLAGTPPALELPLDRPRPRAASHAGANEGLVLSRAELDALEGLARASGGTLFMVVFSAFNVLLHRWSGQRDLVVGTPVRARSRPELEGLIGPFVNAVVLRTCVAPGMTFRELLSHVRDTTLDAFSHQDLPLERLGSRPPVVRAFFSLQDARNRPRGFGPAAIRQVHVLPQAAADDLMLWMMERPDGLLAMLNYATELFDADTARRFLAELRTLLAEVVKNPDVPVARVRLLPDAERDALERMGQPAVTASLDEVSVPARVAAHASRAPDAPALSDAGTTLGFGALVARARRLAHALLDCRGEARGPVALALEPSVELAVALLAALEAGVPALLLDPRHPAPRLTRLCEAARPAVLLTRSAARDALGLPCPHVLALDEAQAQLAAYPDAPLAAPAPGGAALEVWRADGAGALTRLGVPRVALSASLSALARTAGLAATDVALHVLPPGHESVAVSLLLPLYAGARLHVAPAEALGDGAALAQLADAHGVTWLMAPPSSLRAMVAAGWRGGAAVRVAALGPVPPELAAAVRERAPASLALTALEGTGGLPALTRTLEEAVPASYAGHVLAPFGARVLEPEGLPSPVGVPGALQLALPGRAPWSTHDRARWRADGTLELLGRTDARAVVGGVRAGAEELEAALRAHPAVADAAAEVHADLQGEPRWVAYVVAKAGEAVTGTELRRHVRRLLPEPLVPQAVLECEALPAADDGSVARNLLASPYRAEAREHVAPRTEAERLLAGLWKELLGVEAVGVHDNFFELGGYSLLVFQLIGRVAERTGRRLNPRHFLLETLEQVAAQLGEPSVQAAAPPAEPQERGGGLLGKLRGMLSR